MNKLDERQHFEQVNNWCDPEETLKTYIKIKWEQTIFYYKNKSRNCME